MAKNSFATLREGSTGDAVVNLQDCLKLVGVYSCKSNGVFDERTKAAVIKFQKNNAMTADGIVRRATMSALVRCWWY
ncbi:putative peptidoglycan-binding domain-containing protein [Rivularia sp. PCC 7116]|uniref:peptidoglycan-binding domain-containing protein n=1 Tax=Rivularia sp. PCC 7116 TaxID=373994 RepID=UPI00029ECEB6|nr:peptidoglycan-binding domain-containing protein [Rivularia sp. PCC 7116]AFY57231.1 putative peptidoglycan-binding domain-containing protein [Rivularia sp. PCC 7116]